MTNFVHMKYLANKIVETVEVKDKDYGSSWRKRGGTGAFMMLARKWDRIENMVKDDHWDIFETLKDDRGGVKDDIDDLIGYLLLVREHVDTDGEVAGPTPDYVNQDRLLDRVFGPNGGIPNFGENK